MGLDMMLYSGTGIEKVTEGVGEDAYTYTEVVNREEVAYWRKFNALHRWMVENVQNGVDDCGSYEVTPEHFKKLNAAVNLVLGNPSLAEAEFPTTSGFFFGSTDYDEWYWENMEKTQRILNKLDMSKRYWYHSSW